MRGDLAESSAFVRARPHFAAGRAQIQTVRLRVVAAERLALHREPALLLREAFVLPLPALPGIARAKDGGLTVGARARPHRGAVHRKHPRASLIARVRNDGEADVADRLRHLFADAVPLLAGPIEPIDAAMILLPQ